MPGPFSTGHLACVSGVSSIALEGRDAVTASCFNVCQRQFPDWLQDALQILGSPLLNSTLSGLPEERRRAAIGWRNGHHSAITIIEAAADMQRGEVTAAAYAHDVLPALNENLGIGGGTAT